MAATIDMSRLTFRGELVMAISELVRDEVVNAPELSLFHTIYPGIVSRKEAGFIGEGGLVGKKGQGCNKQPDDWKINVRPIIWDPERWDVVMEMCFVDLQTSAEIYSLKKGVDISDFSDTDYMSIVVDVLSTALKKFIIRLVWFNDKDAANTPAGIITAGVDVEYFNIIDGFWKQMIAASSTAGSPQRVTIYENTQNSYAAQILSSGSIQSYLSDLVYKADIRLRSQSNGIILCTQSVYDTYAMSLKGIYLESMFTNLTEGIKTLTFDGKPLIAVPVWDETIRAYEDTGTKWNNPHRIVYTTKSVLGVAVDSETSFSDVRVFFDPKSDTVNLRVGGMADAKLIDPALFQLAI